MADVYWLDAVQAIMAASVALPRLLADVERLAQVERQLAEYNGPRCRAVCEVESCSRLHFCLLAEGHEGRHIPVCLLNHLVDDTIRAEQKAEAAERRADAASARADRLRLDLETRETTPCP